MVRRGENQGELRVSSCSWLASPPEPGLEGDRTYAHHEGHAVEGSNGADGEEGHEESHVKPSAGSLLEDGAGVGLKHQTMS